MIEQNNGRRGKTVRRVLRRFVDDAVPGRAAEMAFYFFLSLFPVLVTLLAVLGMFLDAQWLVRDSIIDRLSLVAPPSTARLFDRLLDHLAGRPGGPFWIGMLAALWAASSGMVSTICALNRAYDVRIERSWWKRRLVGLALTLVFLVLTAFAMMLLAYGVPIAEAAARSLGLGDAFVLAWRFGQWPVILGTLLLAFRLLYRYAPHRTDPPRGWLQPGTLAGIVLWLVASLGLKFYVANFARYDLAYGSLGAVIVLLLWFYVTGMALLIGAEINAEMEGTR